MGRRGEINERWRHRDHPWRALWKWGIAGHSSKRWRALVEWTQDKAQKRSKRAKQAIRNREDARKRIQVLQKEALDLRNDISSLTDRIHKEDGPTELRRELIKRRKLRQDELGSALHRIRMNQSRRERANHNLDEARDELKAYREARTKYRKKFRFFKKKERHHVPADHDSDCMTTFDGKPCPEWIAEQLALARQHGWHGYLVSGYRTPEYSEQLCYRICGAPSCPGLCAGRQTNHSCQPTYKCCPHEGAADCSDQYNLLNILRSLGSPLHGGALPRDTVHFSYSGN